LHTQDFPLYIYIHVVYSKKTIRVHNQVNTDPRTYIHSDGWTDGRTDRRANTAYCELFCINP